MLRVEPCLISSGKIYISYYLCVHILLSLPSYLAISANLFLCLTRVNRFVMLVWHSCVSADFLFLTPSPLHWLNTPHVHLLVWWYWHIMSWSIDSWVCAITELLCVSDVMMDIVIIVILLQLVVIIVSDACFSLLCLLLVIHQHASYCAYVFISVNFRCLMIFCFSIDSVFLLVWAGICGGVLCIDYLWPYMVCVGDSRISLCY